MIRRDRYPWKPSIFGPQVPFEGGCPPAASLIDGELGLVPVVNLLTCLASRDNRLIGTNTRHLTKRVDDLEKHTDQRIDALKAELNSRLDRVEARLSKLEARLGTAECTVGGAEDRRRQDGRQTLRPRHRPAHTPDHPQPLGELRRRTP